MKIKIAIFFLFLSVFATTIAQEDKLEPEKKSLFKGGLRAGFTASQISGDNLAGFNKFGAYAGAFTNFPLMKNRRLLMQIELNFMMKGSHTFVPRSQDIPLNSYSLTLLYVEMPLLLKWRPLLGKLTGLEIEMGPAINFLCHHSEQDIQGKLVYLEKFRWYELALDIGIGYLFKEHFGVNLRWSTSIIPVRVPQYRDMYDHLRRRQFNDVIGFVLIYQF